MKLPSPGPGAVVAVLVWAWLCGCGPKEEKLYRVSGSVTFNGKPIPKGNIYFDPRGDGPQGFATIVDGKYDTAEQGKGVRGGSTYDVRVGGFTGIVANEAPFGQPLFPETGDRRQETGVNRRAHAARASSQESGVERQHARERVVARGIDAP